MGTNLSHKDTFEGFQDTPLLWENNNVEFLKQFSIDKTSETFFPKTEHRKLRLGKWIEAYTSFQLQKQSNIEILEENLQIRSGKQTIGELDILLLNNNQPIHLEIAYKFYLYDSTRAYSDNLAYWIGPNRNDSFVYKINKLREKQLPLLFKKETIEVLKTKNLIPDDFEQYVHFKAQLYVPYPMSNIDLTPLNKKCIQGWYLKFNFLLQLKYHKFHIPNKLNWLRKPNIAIDWLDFNEAQIAIKHYIDKRQSPLCWIKSPENDLQKCFITWW
ncbi:DUF1853 family protein [Winogradskyella sp.]|uniref:DUF1853 family protein n=1 Tax=Winogradskyella sp. TaxID=1883156 RepID=UPI00260AFE46|nr:DUF1853 family protein [Winogradskyella sp.]